MSADRKLDTVRKLLAKAERTNVPAEADAFREKVMELMQRYSIDEALLSQRKDTPRAARPPHVNGQAFTRSFLVGFAVVVVRRLKDIRKSTIVENDDASGNTALVLFDREKAVVRHFREQYPRTMVPRSSTISAGRGFSAGQVAGARARPGPGRAPRVSEGHRKRLLTPSRPAPRVSTPRGAAVFAAGASPVVYYSHDRFVASLVPRRR